jgi:hypothetical protein
MNQKQVREMQQLYDRLLTVIRENNSVSKAIQTSLIAEPFGISSIGIESTIDGFDLRELQKEFKYVHFMDGRLVISD